MSTKEASFEGRPNPQLDQPTSLDRQEDDQRDPRVADPRVPAAMSDEEKGLTPITRRILDRAEERAGDPPDDLAFVHSVMASVGLPRSAQTARLFERRSGNAAILLEAGRLWNGEQWMEQPLPFGAKPRLILVHISSEAIKTRSREVDMGRSVREFLVRLGLSTSGGRNGGYGHFWKQMEALAACRLTLGFANGDYNVTVNTQPIRRFDAWRVENGEHWRGRLELSPDFYETLTEHAVPLDHSALAVLKHSALALDIYMWLASRLWRIRDRRGVMLSWHNLHEQFGQEYANIKHFKREFKQALHQVRAAYLAAKIEEVDGGLLLKTSPPPVPKLLLPGN